MIHPKISVRFKIDPRRLEPEARKALEAGWKECAKLAVETAKRKAPEGETGEMRKGIEATQISYTGFRLISRADYSIFIELGTRAHWIEPTKKKALHWEEGGQDRFSKGHMVSGINPRPFIQPAVYDNIQEFQKIHQRHFSRLFG